MQGGFVADDEWCPYCSESLPCSCFDEDDEDDMTEFVECDYYDNGDLD
jgi:hypothetical protein